MVFDNTEQFTIALSEGELIFLALAVETLMQTLHDKSDKAVIEPLVRKTRIAAEVGKGGFGQLELTFSGMLKGGAE